MKIAVYEVRRDEVDVLTRIAAAAGVELVCTGEIPTAENSSMAEGCEGVSVLGQGKIDAALIRRYREIGVKALSTRTIGFDHIDLHAAEEAELHICNAGYAPNGVADFTVMLMLMCLRNYKQAMWRGQVNDFSLNGLQGRELKDMTVGVMGTGRIGRQVVRNLSGFGCRILAYDTYPSKELEGQVEYVKLDTLLRESDIITLHLALNETNHHIINRYTIAKMKKGVILINCARGELADIEALVTGIETEQIGALGMDTIEGDAGIIHQDHRTDILSNRNWFYLHQFRNVIMTQHMAFYTDAAVESMVRCGIEGIVQMLRGETCPTQLC